MFFTVNDMKEELLQQSLEIYANDLGENLSNRFEIEDEETKKQEYTENERKRILHRNIHFAVVGLTVTVTLSAMIIEMEAIIFISTLSTLIISTYSLLQRQRISMLDTFRVYVKKLRKVLVSLTHQNNLLHQSVSQLENEVQRLSGLESKLRNIVVEQGSSTKHFMNLCKENESIMREMEESLKASIMRQVISAVLKTDKNEDCALNGNEIDALIFRLQNLNGVKIDNKAKLRQLLSSNKSISGAVAIAKSLIEDKDSSNGCGISTDINRLRPKSSQANNYVQ